MNPKTFFSKIADVLDALTGKSLIGIQREIIESQRKTIGLQDEVITIDAKIIALLEEQVSLGKRLEALLETEVKALRILAHMEQMAND